MAILDEVKILLSISDDKQDKLIEKIIKNTEKRLINMLPDGVDSVPDELSYIVEDVAIKRYNRIGAEGMSSESIEGRSSTFQESDFDEYLSDIERVYPIDSSKRGEVLFF